MQRACVRQAARRQRRQGLAVQGLGVGLGALQPHQRDIGGLVLGLILARRFAQRGRIGGDVQNVVHHLKRQADGGAIGLQGSCSLRRGVATSGTHHHAGLQQGTGFELVHLAQLVLGQGPADAGQVNGLATGHAGTARSARQQTAQARPGGWPAQQRHRGSTIQRPGPAARRPPARRWPSQTARARWACPGAARRCPCTACRRAPGNRRGSVQPRKRRAKRRHCHDQVPLPLTASNAASTSNGRSRLPPSSTA